MLSVVLSEVSFTFSLPDFIYLKLGFFREIGELRLFLCAGD